MVKEANLKLLNSWNLNYYAENYLYLQTRIYVIPLNKLKENFNVIEIKSPEFLSVKEIKDIYVCSALLALL